MSDEWTATARLPDFITKSRNLSDGWTANACLPDSIMDSRDPSAVWSGNDYLPDRMESKRRFPDHLKVNKDCVPDRRIDKLRQSPLLFENAGGDLQVCSTTRP